MKNKILKLILIIINCIIVFCVAKNRVVSRQLILDTNSNSINDIINAKITDSYTFFDNAYDLFLGRGFPTLLTAFITVIISFIVNKLFIRQELKVKNYIILFCCIVILNIIVYRFGINIDNGMRVNVN